MGGMGVWGGMGRCLTKFDLLSCATGSKVQQAASEVTDFLNGAIGKRKLKKKQYQISSNHDRVGG